VSGGGWVRRVGVASGALLPVRIWVGDVSDEDGGTVIRWTRRREGAARYYDTETAHRVAEVARRLGMLAAGESVRVYRARLPR